MATITERNTEAAVVPVRPAWLVLIVLLGVPFAWFAYNSGYGYDALEYLIIGRSLLDGYPFLHFIPSKSIALYGTVAGFQAIGLADDHVGVAIALGAVHVAILLATYFVCRRVLGDRAARIATGLVVVCSYFMEMNFLEPEVFVALCGLAAFALCLRGFAEHRAWPLCVAGGLISLGFQFKGVAAFYGIGMAVWLTLASLCEERRLQSAVRRLAPLIGGALIGLVVPYAYFAITGRGEEFLRWTVVYPSLHYPSSTDHLSKLWTKLAWYPFLVVVTLALSAWKRSRPRVWCSRPLTLAFCMGAFATLALLKRQASHYYYPSAVFMAIWMAGVWDLALPTRWNRRTRVGLSVGAFAAAAVIVLSIGLYSPRIYQRFLSLNDFSREQRLAESVQRSAGPEEHVLFVGKGSTLLYWVSHRYPNTRFLNLEPPTTYYLGLEEEALVRALDDESLQVVEFNPENPRIPDPDFRDNPHRMQRVEQFQRELSRTFAEDEKASGQYVFWRRRPVEE